MTATAPPTPSATAQLLLTFPTRWQAATRSPFLDAAGDGTLAPEAFDRWLVQDRWFLQALVRAWGHLLQSAPADDFALLASGIQAFTDELAWFEQVAADRALDVEQPPRHATAAYCAALMALAQRSYPEAITAMWAVEAAYLRAWQHVAPGAPAYTAFITHWADEGFAGFVAALGAVVDRELPDGPTAGATAAFGVIADHEASFWRMTLNG